MKSIFKLFLVFFSLAMALLLDHSALQINDYTLLSGAISHPEQETCVLVSNNIFNGEIRGVEEEILFSGVGSSTFVASSSFNKNAFNKNKTQLYGCFIHNLSTDNQKVHQIRAP